MPELQRAREHLIETRQMLAAARLYADRLGRTRLREAETAFLAALSWAWDAQERASTEIRMGIYQGGLPIPYVLADAPPPA